MANIHVIDDRSNVRLLFALLTFLLQLENIHWIEKRATIDLVVYREAFAEVRRKLCSGHAGELTKLL